VCHNPKSQKNTKNTILGVQGHSRSSMLALLRSSSLVLIIISMTSVPICNCFHARRGNSSKTCADLLEPKGSALGLLKSETFICRLFRSILGISSQFTLEMCAAAKIAKNSLETRFGGSRSFKIIGVDKKARDHRPVLVMISNMSVPICNCFHIRRANSGKITSFKADTFL